MSHNESDARVATLLLEFSSLPGVQAAEFLGGVNEYMFSSAKTKRRFIQQWAQIADDMPGSPPSGSPSSQK